MLFFCKIFIYYYDFTDVGFNCRDAGDGGGASTCENGLSGGYRGCRSGGFVAGVLRERNLARGGRGGPLRGR